MLSEEQARAILDLRLQRLTALGRDEIADELNTIGAEIRDYLEILSSRARIQQIVKDELIAVRDEFGTPRRTELAEGGPDMDDEDLIAREDMVVTFSHRAISSGAACDLPGAAARRQGPVGHGDEGGGFRHPPVRGQHAYADPVLLLARHRLQGEGLAAADRHAAVARQVPASTCCRLQEDERITTIMPLPEDEDSWGELDVMFATKRHGPAQQAVRLRPGQPQRQDRDEAGGRWCRNPQCGDCSEDDDVLLTTSLGQCIRFPVTDIRVFAGRNSVGVRGISLGKRGQRHLHVDPAAQRSHTRGTHRLSEAGLGLPLLALWKTLKPVWKRAAALNKRRCRHVE
jgi:DNA gyrase subunit A